MQVMMKIAEKQRKTRAGFVQLMNYISRDSFKTFGIGTSDNKNIAIKHYLSNKDLHKKNRDGKDRFTYQEIFSFGADVPIETVIDIMLEFCEDNFYDKGFNSFFAVHTDTDNIHCHVIADNVNFNTGDMIHSVTQKQFDSMSQKKKEKNETFVYEHQRKLFEDICIKNGLNISDKERYEYMHEQKVKEGRTWLSKEQYRAGKDKDSWRNILKDKLEQIYKNEDITEDNIKDITNKYGLEVTRHNKTNKTITFAITDEQGKKQRIKLERLSAQEKELNRDSTEENIFIYDNFFKVKEKEKEQEEERKREQEKAKREQEEKIRLEQEKIKKQREERARAEAEKERLRLEQEERAREQEAKAKRQAEEKARLERERQAELERLRLEQEEKERLERERLEQEEKHDLESKQVDLDSLMSKIDSYKLVEEYDLFDTLPPFQVIQEDIIYDSSSGEGDTYLAKSLIIDVKGEEYWDNMNVKDIKQWENTGLFTIYYTDSMDNFKEFAGYEDYSKDTIKHFLKENTEVAEELAKQYMPNNSKKKEQDSKDIEIKKDKGREYDFN